MLNRRCVVSGEIFVSPLGLFVGVVQSSGLTVASLLADPGLPPFPIRKVACCSSLGTGVESSR